MNHIPATVLAAIDTIAAGLAEQRQVSFNKELDMCAYRSPDGCKCAVGWLIPDELYVETLEGAGPSTILSCHSQTFEWAHQLQGDQEIQRLEKALIGFQAFHDNVLLTEAATGFPTYKWLLQSHANDPDDMLEASIKRALIQRAERAYGVSHESA